MSGFEDWGLEGDKGTIVYICQNQPLGLWLALEYMQWSGRYNTTNDWRVAPDEFRKSYPYELVSCKCENCTNEIEYRKRIAK